jgi:CubicO group peptidase (beta-lactamase class C family)
MIQLDPMSGATTAILAAVLLATPVLASLEQGSEPVTRTEAEGYFPSRGDWERRSPQEMGMDPALIDDAIRLSLENETSIPREALLAIQQWRTNNEDTHRETIGPVRDHGDVSGVIVKDGYIVAEWGDPERVDMSYSTTKSFITVVLGLAVDHGLIGDVHAPVHRHIRGQDGFDDFSSEHNRKITWDHMLRMTSEWEGEVWGKPWHAEGRRDPRNLPLQEPGTYLVYSNVASARLALAAMQVWREPLPEILKRHVMDPIGASTTWRWQGYDNAWVTIDGRWMQGSSSGGGWGASMWISAFDLARFGLFTLHRGTWDGEQLLSEAWFDLAETPTDLLTTRGFMNWNLNTNRELLPSAPESALYHSGSGNRVYVDRENGLVVVIRWMETGVLDEFIGTVLQAVDPSR